MAPPDPTQPSQPEILLIVGVQRSGTTLLRTVLHAHPEVCVGYECAFARRLFGKYSGGIDCARDLEAFLDDLYRVMHFKYWELPREAIAAALTGAGKAVLPYDEAILLIGMLLRERLRPGAKWIGFKDPDGLYHLDLFLDLFPQAKVLHIIRDPRAVLASEKAKRIKAGKFSRSKTILAVGRRYRRMAKERTLKLADDRYIEVIYEELVGDFPRTIDRLLSMLGLQTVPEILDYHRIAREAGFTPEGQLWQHARTLDPPDRSRLTAYRHELDPGELAGIEALCRRELREFYGLEPETGPIRRAIQLVRLTARKAFSGLIVDPIRKGRPVPR